MTWTEQTGPVHSTCSETALVRLKRGGVEFREARQPTRPLVGCRFALDQPYPMLPVSVTRSGGGTSSTVKWAMLRGGRCLPGARPDRLGGLLHAVCFGKRPATSSTPFTARWVRLASPSFRGGRLKRTARNRAGAVAGVPFVLHLLQDLHGGQDGWAGRAGRAAFADGVEKVQGDAGAVLLLGFDFGRS
jgi:hypothetical protein